MLILSSLME